VASSCRTSQCSARRPLKVAPEVKTIFRQQ
jgi:hypothetical protein